MGFIESVYKKLLEQKQGDMDDTNDGIITTEEIIDFTKWPRHRIIDSLSAVRSAGSEFTIGKRFGVDKIY